LHSTESNAFNRGMAKQSPLEVARAALKRALETAGGPTGLAQKLEGITPQAISQWDRVPPGRVIAVEAATGEPRHLLRPDIYPEPSIQLVKPR
jgi:DNA-binding transcriptional regulator YdaS (Cro superfamily)